MNLPCVANTNDMVNVAEGELKKLIGQNATRVREAEK